MGHACVDDLAFQCMVDDGMLWSNNTEVQPVLCMWPWYSSTDYDYVIDQMPQLYTIYFSTQFGAVTIRKWHLFESSVYFV